MRTRVKICGITTLKDALMAVDCGADALGFVFAKSKRHITPEAAKSIIREIPPFVNTVGVFMNQSIQTINDIIAHTGIDTVQLHGDESLDFCLHIKRPVLKRICVKSENSRDDLISRMKDYQMSTFLLDPGAGDGVPFQWEIAQNLPFRLIIAGGLNADNIGQVVRLLNPYGVDVSSGVESEPGKKDMEKIKRFIEEVQ